MSKLSPSVRGTLIFDGFDSTYQYVGEASFGTSTASPFWRIKRLTNASGVLTLQWADGNDEYDNIWDNRASLTYT